MAREQRAKAKALVLALKAKPAEDAAASAAADADKPADEQVMKHLLGAIATHDAGEALACLKTLFKAFSSDDEAAAPEAE